MNSRFVGDLERDAMGPPGGGPEVIFPDDEDGEGFEIPHWQPGGEGDPHGGGHADESDGDVACVEEEEAIPLPGRKVYSDAIDMLWRSQTGAKPRNAFDLLRGIDRCPELSEAFRTLQEDSQDSSMERVAEATAERINREVIEPYRRYSRSLGDDVLGIEVPDVSPRDVVAEAVLTHPGDAVVWREARDMLFSLAQVMAAKCCIRRFRTRRRKRSGRVVVSERIEIDKANVSLLQKVLTTVGKLQLDIERRKA